MKTGKKTFRNRLHKSAEKDIIKKYKTKKIQKTETIPKKTKEGKQ